jgi:hypothetical protein
MKACVNHPAAHNVREFIILPTTPQILAPIHLLFNFLNRSFTFFVDLLARSFVSNRALSSLSNAFTVSSGSKSLDICFNHFLLFSKVEDVIDDF